MRRASLKALALLIPLVTPLITPRAAWADDRAQDRPLTMPTRDVDVIYLMAGPDAPMQQRMRWGITEGKLRVDPPSPGLYVIIDTTSHTVQAVRESNRSVVQLDGTGPIPGVTQGGSFTRKGDAEVAGLACTQWETKDTSGRTVQACLTADGVLLRVEADGLVMLQAMQVNFTPQAEAVFQVPADYRKITPPPVSQKRP